MRQRHRAVQTAFGPKPIPAATLPSALAAFRRPWGRGRTGGEQQEQQRGRRRIGVRQRRTVELGPRGVLDPDRVVHEVAVGGIGDDELARRVFDVARQFRAPARGVDPDDACARQRSPNIWNTYSGTFGSSTPTCGGRSGSRVARSHAARVAASATTSRQVQDCTPNTRATLSSSARARTSAATVGARTPSEVVMRTRSGPPLPPTRDESGQRTSYTW